ncbi:MAG TPA: D-aminoacyl-tRNA deacylase [Bryobacteraceae bacterium]|nr:D-aminoacyl-tRNA deacylase [Bryobacteraceae bacterium]
MFNGYMRALLQRVSEARVTVDGVITGQISAGLVVFLGVVRTDTKAQAEAVAQKVTQLRIFSDSVGKMNLSLGDVSGELLIVSQFTLCANMRRGNRPSYSDAAKAEAAKELYEYFVGLCRAKGFRVETGTFQARMQVHLINDGPVTIMYDSES